MTTNDERVNPADADFPDAWDALGRPSYECGVYTYVVVDGIGHTHHVVAESRSEAVAAVESDVSPDDFAGEPWTVDQLPAENPLRIGFPHVGDITLPLDRRIEKGSEEVDAFDAYVTATCAEWAASVGLLDAPQIISSTIF
jgi:hypothetical protein